MSRILGLRQWDNHEPQVCAEVKSSPKFVKAIKGLLVKDADQDSVLALAKKMAKGGVVEFNPNGFTIRTATPKPATKIVGSSEPAVFPVKRLAPEPYPDPVSRVFIRHGERENRKRFSEADRNDHDHVIGVYVPYAAKQHPDLFRKHMVKLRAARDI